MPPLSTEVTASTAKYHPRSRRSAKQRGALHSQSMPPSMSHDEEIRALRSHLKKKRSQMPIASHSLRASTLSQRTLQNLDMDSSFEDGDDVHHDSELEDLFKRKQSLTLDERIAAKNGKDPSLTLDERVALKKMEKERYGTSLILTKTEDIGSGRKLRRKTSSRSIDNSIETEDISSDEATIPDCESVDSIPFSYTADEASSVVEAFEKKLAAAANKEKMVKRLSSFEEKIQSKIAASKRSRSKATTSGPRRRSMSAPHPGFDRRQKAEKDHNETSKKDTVTHPSLNKRLEKLHRKYMSYEERVQLKIARDVEVNTVHRRRSVSAPRPGVVKVNCPAKAPKEETSKSKEGSVDYALDSFEDRLKHKLSQGSLPKRSLSATQSERVLSHDSKLAQGKGVRCRNKVSLSQSNNVGLCSNAWQCGKCTYINTSNVSRSCQMCLEPKTESHENTNKRLTKASKSLICNDKELSRLDKCNSRHKLSRTTQSERTLNSTVARRKNMGVARRGMSSMSKSVNAGSFVSKWNCGKCTYSNEATSKKCKMCMEPSNIDQGKNDYNWTELGPVIDQAISLSLKDK